MDDSLLRMYDLKGKSAIVTGVSRGLGISFARGLSKAGCDLTVVARNFEKLQEVARELRKYGHKVLPLRVDVTNGEDVDVMVAETLSAYGKIDILVNNAGISAVADAASWTQDAGSGLR
jgi:NAD(P)-dependent dehydrogenase (short-subunit alcohol dehydrogenase family)